MRDANSERERAKGRDERRYGNVDWRKERMKGSEKGTEGRGMER